jgi:hypothetical protein
MELFLREDMAADGCQFCAQTTARGWKGNT